MTINQIISRWRDSTSNLERMMDLTLICLLFILLCAGVFSIAIYGLTITLSVFETLWFISALTVCTLALRVRILFLREESDYHEIRDLEERKILLYWTTCLIIVMVSLSLSLSFPYISGAQT